MCMPCKKLKLMEDRKKIIKKPKTKKVSRLWLIPVTLQKELLGSCFRLIIYIFDTVIRLGYFLDHWKVATITLIPKLGKPKEQIISYRSINLSLILSKVLIKLLLEWIKPLISENNLIPEHQFGLCEHHATIEQIRCFMNTIN